jgi:hypothetical protein
MNVSRMTLMAVAVLSTAAAAAQDDRVRSSSSQYLQPQAKPDVTLSFGITVHCTSDTNCFKTCCSLCRCANADATEKHHNCEQYCKSSFCCHLHNYLRNYMDFGHKVRLIPIFILSHYTHKVSIFQ